MHYPSSIYGSATQELWLPACLIIRYTTVQLEHHVECYLSCLSINLQARIMLFLLKQWWVFLWILTVYFKALKVVYCPFKHNLCVIFNPLLWVSTVMLIKYIWSYFKLKHDSIHMSNYSALSRQYYQLYSSPLIISLLLSVCTWLKLQYIIFLKLVLKNLCVVAVKLLPCIH